MADLVKVTECRYLNNPKFKKPEYAKYFEVNKPIDVVYDTLRELAKHITDNDEELIGLIRQAQSHLTSLCQAENGGNCMNYDALTHNMTGEIAKTPTRKLDFDTFTDKDPYDKFRKCGLSSGSK
ncbi:hypothetical protein EIN_229590 [Entamoeba invadens IP1]|uniref:Uncharacterized protein n=1 Tax=Entamoeba invadens IP1 TaxID=370355 RepID=A0A0A1U2Y4_ENTIV|nr:hypothetical protein EIN_229590 [Entamoeba invadens IP1]ELP88426.1 hypothetical protein EIN_229590 [Entamoeba invadens IP1]|eukprot:XP_004255197.1 hypothetical protein EIN_229590 [Entamoeba invadens IP1]